MIGVTTNDRSVSIWANSHHLCSELLTKLSDQGYKQQPNGNKHNEENSRQIDSDADDHRKIKTTLRKCVHPLEVDSQLPNVLFNIYIGEESDRFVNGSKTTEFGAKK